MATLLKDVRRLSDSEPVCVRVAGDTIDRVGTLDDIWSAGDEIVDAGGKLALPGFVNAHTHLPMVLLRGLADDVPLATWLERHVWPIERALRSEDVHWCALLALAESIRCGVVAVADMYFHNDAIARAVTESGVRALLSYGMIAPSLAAGGREELEKTERFADAWDGASDGRIRVAVSPHAVYTCGEDVWRESVALAVRRDLLVHTHLSETRGEVDDWRKKTGLTPPAYLEQIGALAAPTLAAHCTHVTAEDVDLFARRGVRVAHCPKSNAKLGSGTAPLSAFRAGGVATAVGTDGAASNDRLDVLEELRFACLLARAGAERVGALSARDALGMATHEGRLALGLPKANVEAGDPADIVLVEVEGAHTAPRHDAASTLVFASQSSDVTDVFVAGRPLLRERKLLAFDEERVQLEVARLAARLRRN